ncbi:MAG: hypothetical protein VYA51_08600 [Planctomycetota bacterium]|nr:hypothetical protein [Planctomycetota bacterium]
MNCSLHRLSLVCGAVALCCSSGAAQSFRDLVESRNGAQPYASIFQVELGAIGAQADSGDATQRGLGDEISWDAKVYYRDETFASRRGALEAYAGRDGVFAALTDGTLIGDDTVTRIELRARPWMFYRDGFYDGDELVQNGFYEGADYESYMGFGREAQDGLYIEFGPYYRQHEFAPSSLTNPAFQVPDDFNAYGGRAYLEQRAIQMDRRSGLPQQGFLLTLTGEREWNDSEGTFGLIGAGGEGAQLPASVWRARGRLEWYVPQSDSWTWEIFAYGGMQDARDRVFNSEGQRPLGHEWADAQLRLRWLIGRSITLTPFAHAQYSKTSGAGGASGDSNFFFGGGAEAYWHLGDALSLHGYYSYLDNENRPSIRIDQDLRGQHMFYLGMVVRLGAARR